MTTQGQSTLTTLGSGLTHETQVHLSSQRVPLHTQLGLPAHSPKPLPSHNRSRTPGICHCVLRQLLQRMLLNHFRSPWLSHDSLDREDSICKSFWTNWSVKSQGSKSYAFHLTVAITTLLLPAPDRACRGWEGTSRGPSLRPKTGASSPPPSLGSRPW